MKPVWMAAALCALSVSVMVPGSAMAQEERSGQLVSFEMKDAQIRSVLEAAFKQAGIKNFIISPDVVGFVTMTITDQPFENALRMIMRANTIPLTFTKESGVYFVKPRTLNTPVNNTPEPPAPDLNNTTPAATYEAIQVTYIDPVDLQAALGNFVYVHSFARMGGAGGGGGMGGMGGGMMGGGMGGMGGGMMGGGMGGGMMGGMGGGMMGGGMGGGMMGGGMGGMGGGMMGGGRNF